MNAPLTDSPSKPLASLHDLLADTRGDVQGLARSPRTVDAGNVLRTRRKIAPEVTPEASSHAVSAWTAGPNRGLSASGLCSVLD